MKLSPLITASLFSTLSASVIAQDAMWQPVMGADKLRQFMSGLKVERMLAGGEVARGEYHADGAGTLVAWGAEKPRNWTIEGEDRICISVDVRKQCYQLERHAVDAGRYRVHDSVAGRFVEFHVVERGAVVQDEPEQASAEGGAATPSAAELAAELSNPNTAVASLTFKNQFRWYEGSLPGANKQSNYTLLFQPALPFVLGNGDKIIWRPAIPLIFDQPTPQAGGGFDGTTGLGDIVFDLAYAPKRDDGLLLAYGIITSLPTATNDLGSDRWTLGPEFLLGKITPRYVAGIFPNHQWDIGGSGDRDINLTTIQPFYTYLPGGGWSVGTGPSINYDWEAEQWTVPLQINVGKTVVLNGRPWKLSAEVNYYVEKPDQFGPEWMLSLNIAPVVKNGLATWFGL